MLDNTVRAVFNYDRECVTRELHQYDYGMKLVFPNLTLPHVYEVQFQNQPKGEQTTVLGDETGVAIPSQYFQTGEDIYAYVFLHSREADGFTAYSVRIPIIPRTDIVDPTTPEDQDVISQTIAALNEGVSKVEGAIDTITETISDIVLASIEDGTIVVPAGPQGEEGPRGPKGDDGEDYVLTEEDKTEIAGLVDMTGVVKYSEDQELTLEEQQQACFNIGAEPLEFNKIVPNLKGCVYSTREATEVEVHEDGSPVIYISSNWATIRHIILPCSPGDVYTVKTTAVATYARPVMFLGAVDPETHTRPILSKPTAGTLSIIAAPEGAELAVFHGTRSQVAKGLVEYFINLPTAMRLDALENSMKRLENIVEVTPNSMVISNKRILFNQDGTVTWEEVQE